MDDIVILSGARTAIGTFGGALAGVPPIELSATAAKAALDRAEVEGDQIGHVVFGHVINTEPRDMYLSRAASMEAGVPDTTPAMNVNRLCGSGAQAIVSVIQSLALGDAEYGLAGGAGIGSLTSMTSGFSLDPNELARRITILPVAGGGFRVRAGRDAAIFTQLGFHANDIVLAINGQPVDNQGDVRAVFESFRPGEPLAITVRRGERQLVLTPDLSMLGEAGQR